MSRFKSVGKFAIDRNPFIPTMDIEKAFHDDKLTYGWKEPWSVSRFKRALENNKLPVLETQRKMPDKTRPRGFAKIEMIDKPKRV